MLPKQKPNPLDSQPVAVPPLEVANLGDLMIKGALQDMYGPEPGQATALPENVIPLTSKNAS